MSRIRFTAEEVAGINLPDIGTPKIRAFERCFELHYRRHYREWVERLEALRTVIMGEVRMLIQRDRVEFTDNYVAALNDPVPRKKGYFTIVRAKSNKNGESSAAPVSATPTDNSDDFFAFSPLPPMRGKGPSREELVQFMYYLQLDEKRIGEFKAKIGEWYD